MAFTKEALIERKEALVKGVQELQQKRAQIEQNLLATDGAIQEVDYWLSILEADEQKIE